MNLTQLLVTQQNVDALSQQFGLSEEQTLEAMGALLPAFSEGLKRQTSSPQGAAGFIETLATGRHRHYADDPSNAVSAFGVNDGNAILGHLFGGKDTSRAVANHASAASGIGSSILKQMLPVIASMVMGSLFKGATGNAARGGRGGGLGGMLGSAAGGGILGQLIEGLAGGMLSGGSTSAPRRRTTQTRRRQQPTGLEDLLGEMLGGGTQRQTRNSPQSRQGGGGILDQLLNPTSRRKRQNPYAPTQPKRQPTRRRPSGGGLGDIFGELLEPGGNTSSEYQRETGSVFDQFLGPNR